MILNVLFLTNILIYFKAIWTRVNVDNEKLSRNKQNKHLVGAFYIKFVLANQYMCINKNAEIYASVSRNFVQIIYSASIVYNVFVSIVQRLIKYMDVNGHIVLHS